MYGSADTGIAAGGWREPDPAVSPPGTRCRGTVFWGTPRTCRARTLSALPNWRIWVCRLSRDTHASRWSYFFVSVQNPWLRLGEFVRWPWPPGSGFKEEWRGGLPCSVQPGAGACLRDFAASTARFAALRWPRADRIGMPVGARGRLGRIQV